MQNVRNEFETWYAKQKRDQYASWHPAETLPDFERQRFPHGRYSTASPKQKAWEVWLACRENQAASSVNEAKINTCETVKISDGREVQICYAIVPHNSSRNHIDAKVSSEGEAKKVGIRYIPEDEGVYWTIEQILEYVVKNLRDEDLISILECKRESEMIAFHSSVGRWIRNTFKLWDPNNPHFDGWHPDEVSTEILKGIWRTVTLRENIGL